MKTIINYGIFKPKKKHCCMKIPRKFVVCKGGSIEISEFFQVVDIQIPHHHRSPISYKMLIGEDTSRYKIDLKCGTIMAFLAMKCRSMNLDSSLHLEIPSKLASIPIDCLPPWHRLQIRPPRAPPCNWARCPMEPCSVQRDGRRRYRPCSRWKKGLGMVNPSKPYI